MANLWRSKRLIYRACEEDDDAIFYSLVENDSEGYINSSMGLPVPQGKAYAKRYRERVQESLCGAIICLPPPDVVPVDDPAKADGGAAAAAATSGKAKPTPIGVVHLGALQPRIAHNRHSQIGINIMQAYQGKGYGSEAIEWIVDWGFRHANLHRIEIGAFEWNDGALRLYERLGFVVEGRKREVAWHDGQYMDVVEMGMLAREWRQRQKEKLVEVERKIEDS